MSNVAHLPIEADRYGACVRQIHVAGLDLTGVAMRAQVRLGGDVPGAPLVDLLTVTNGNAEGLRLVSVQSVAGAPMSHVELVINESTMEALPYAGELGDATQLAWDWQLTLSGRKQRIARGAFVITGDGVTGATAAPINRPMPFGGPRQAGVGMRSGATLTFGDEITAITIDGANLVAPLAAQATEAADAAEASRDAAQLAAATALAASRYFPTRATGETGSTINQLFSTDDGAGALIYYRRTSGGSVEIGRAVTPGTLSAAGGAASVGFQLDAPGALLTDLAAAAGERVSVMWWIPRPLHAAIRAYTGPGYDTDHELQTYIQRALDWCHAHNRTLFFPAGYYRVTGTLKVYGDEDTGATVIEGENEYASMIWGGNLSADILTNDTSFLDFRRFTMRNIALGRGRWGLRIVRSGEQVASLLSLENVRFERHGQGAINVDQYAITWNLSNTVFYFCNTGIRCGRNFNNGKLTSCRFEGLDYPALAFSSPGGTVNGCEDVTLIGPRFEGRNAAGSTGQNVIEGWRLSNLTILGGYVENTFRRFIYERGSLGLVCIKNTHFTGAESDVAPVGLKPNDFDSDGLITFETCRFASGTDGSRQQVRVGANQGMSQAVGYYTTYEHSPHFTTRLLTPASPAVVADLITFTRRDPAASGEPVGGSNQRSLVGTLLIGTQAKSNGNVEYYHLIQVPIVVSAFATGVVTVTLGAIETVIPAPGITVEVAVKPGATKTSAGLTVRVSYSDYEKAFVRGTFTGLSHQGDADTKLLMS